MQSKSLAAHRGSSLVEFFVLLGVLLPVGLGIAMIGKLADLRQTGEQASRYATWEPTVYARSDVRAQDQTRVERRFFGADTAAISSNPAANDEGTINRLWGTASTTPGSLRELSSVSRDRNQTVLPSYTFDTGAADIARVSGQTVAVLGGDFGELGGSSWGIVADGLLRAEIDVAVNSTAYLRSTQGGCPSSSGATGPTGDGAGGNPSSAQTLCLSSAGAILADGWSSSDDTQAVSRIRRFVPSSFVSEIGDTVSNLGRVGIFGELEGLDGAFGHVDMSVLPEYAKP